MSQESTRIVERLLLDISSISLDHFLHLKKRLVKALDDSWLQGFLDCEMASRLGVMKDISSRDSASGRVV